MTITDGHEADYPALHESEHDNSFVTDGNRFDDPAFRRIFVGLMALCAVCAVLAISLGVQKWQTGQLINQLPGVVVVEKDATLVDYVVGNGDKEDRLRLAIFAAERMNRPLTAVETKVAGKDKLLPVAYGTRVPVTHDEARTLVADSDRVQVSMLIYPGDLLDPKRGMFISRDDPKRVYAYLLDHTDAGSYERRHGLNSYQAAFGARFGGS